MAETNWNYNCSIPASSSSASEHAIASNIFDVQIEIRGRCLCIISDRGVTSVCYKTETSRGKKQSLIVDEKSKFPESTLGLTLPAVLRLWKINHN